MNRFNQILKWSIFGFGLILGMVNLSTIGQAQGPKLRSVIQLSRAKALKTQWRSFSQATRGPQKNFKANFTKFPLVRSLIIGGATALVGYSLFNQFHQNHCLSNGSEEEEKNPPTPAEMAKAHGAEFLIHRTPCENVDAILNSQFLHPGQKMNRLSYDYQFQIQAPRYVYLSLSNKQTEDGPWYPDLKKQCALYFSLEVLNDFVGSYHLAKGWLYGNKYDGFFAESDDEKGLQQILHQITDELDGTWGQNEVVLKSSLPLHYLVKVERPKAEDGDRSSMGR